MTTPEPPVPRSRWRAWRRELRQLARLAFMPTGTRVGHLYDIVGTRNLFGESTLFINLGYWKDQPNSLDEASVALAMLVGREAGLGPEDVVVDVGCGFGDQDLLWAHEFAPREIIGVNVSDEQLAVAEQRAGDSGHGGQVRFVKASAMELPQPDGSCTKVTALESAFHFPSRRRFFEEAHRVLAPGGRLVTADLVAQPNVIARWLGRFVSSEVLDTNRYCTGLRDAGFDRINVYSIRQDVFPPLVRYLSRRLRERGMREVNPLLRFIFLPPVARAWMRAADYIIAVGDKPAEPETRAQTSSAEVVAVP